MTGFDVELDALRAHAHHVRGVSELVDEAASAATTVAGNNAAFGMLVGPMLLPWVNQVEAGGVLAVREAAVTVRATADGLRGMVSVYERVDDAVSTSLQRVGGRRD